VHVVVVTRITTSIDHESAALAAALGTTAYEERLRLVAGLPAIVLTTADAGSAAALLAGLRARGQGAVSFEGSEVIASDDMVSMKSFAFEGDALTVAGPRGGRLDYADVLALVRAMHRTSTQTVGRVAEKKLSVGRAILTGGLVASKSVTREETTSAHERDQVLYMFRQSGETPWLMRERGTNYAGLGATLAPASAQNFMAVIQRLRERAPHAVYDERLMKPRSGPAVVSRSGGTHSSAVSTSTANITDLLAHAIARAIVEGCWPPIE